MSDISLSKAVRSNLLNLQSTATQMSKTQERLATGNRVNSALDNPTNFFTASSLNSRASDLSQLLDSVSNAVQTIAAADKGISAITKLVESAQATARQALQTSATIDQVTPGGAAVIATRATSNTTSLTISDGSAGNTASVNTGNLSSVTISDGSGAVPATRTTGSLSALNATGGDITVNGQTVAVGAGDDASDVLSALQTAAGQAGSNFAVVDNSDGTFTLNATGGNDLSFGGNSTTLSELGLPTAGTTVSHQAAVTDTSGNLTINGANIAIAAGDDAAAILSKLQSAATASSGANAFTVTDNAGVLSITGTGGNDITIGGDANVVSALGLTSGTTNGSASVTDTSGSFTINGQSVALADGDDAAAILSKLQAAATASSGASAFTVSNNNGVLSISGTAGNDLVLAGDYNALSALGLTAGTTNGDAAGTPTTTQVANPKREELMNQYNDLLSQIDQLAKDSGFNGVNLLDGDDLSVLFNEDGSSKLDVEGVTKDAAGLGLTALATGGFDDNDDINTTLNTLKSAIDDLRTQASKFGANLSVVETRQDFTKNMINVLETGAANLTLADTNEEAADLLALQTRQQLSSTALSMASQADQAVLRLF